MKKVIVLVGPTASGKTSYSIKLAKKFNAEILNGDSVQIYKELNIGSAKITDDEKEGIPHHLFDVESAKNQFTAYDFQKLVRNKIDEVEIPMIVGGTGFYIKSALYDYEFNKEEDIDFTKYEKYSNEELYEMLLIHDPNIKIDKHNQRRLIRALIQAKSGRPRSEKKRKNVPLYDILTIYLDIDRQILEERLIYRLDKMLEDGLIEEVESLRKEDIHLNVIGYREIDQYLNGDITLEEAKKDIIKASKSLAKRQKTWFKNQMNAHSFDPLDENSINLMEELVNDFLKE